MLFVRPRAGLLRDFVNAAQLKEYMEKYGEVGNVWVPWKNDDRRYYGFGEFKDHMDAQKFVHDSPHLLQTADLIVDFKKPAKQDQASPSKQDKQASTINELTDVLVPLPKDSGKYSWQSYFATKSVKSALMGIGKELDPDYTERLQMSKKALFGDPQISAPGVPLVLFHGPPGTGKTHAMRVICAESKLTPYLLQTAKLRENSYEAPKLWGDVLEKISGLEGAAIFIDEAETLLGRRSVMADYASVEVKSHQKMLETFLKWTDGLQTKTYECGQAPLICLATNLKENIDEAILSRTLAKVEFDLPDSKQCIQWWTKKAQQLSSLEVRALGLLSSMVRLSFRELWAVANCMAGKDADKQKGGAAPAGTVGFSEYVREIMSETRRNFFWSNAVGARFHQAQNAVFTVSSVLFLLDRIAKFREKFRAPRARL